MALSEVYCSDKYSSLFLMCWPNSRQLDIAHGHESKYFQCIGTNVNTQFLIIRSHIC